MGTLAESFDIEGLAPILIHLFRFRVVALSYILLAEFPSRLSIAEVKSAELVK